MRTVAVYRRPQPSQVDALENMAKVLSPGMAAVLERLVAGYLCGIKPGFTDYELGLLRCAGGALSVVNRTEGAASEIGKQAARVVSRNVQSGNLLKAAPNPWLMLR